MSRETRVASIPEIRDDNIKEVLQAIKNTLLVREGNIGDPLDQVATLRDLVALNVATTEPTDEEEGVGGGIINPVLPPPIDGYNPETDYTTPPAPTGLRVSGGFTNVYLEWDGAPYRNHAFTEIWRATVDNLGDAVRIGTTAANVYADPAQPNTTYYYWIRFVSRANVVGPYNLTSGTSATTALDVGAAISAISDEIVNSQLFADLGTRITDVTNGIREVREISQTAVSQTQTLTSQVGANTTSIQTQSRVTDGLNAQYTVKIDNNGYVSGFGLASSPVNGVPRSTFQVRADAFAIAPASTPSWSSATTYARNAVVSFSVGGVTRQYQSRSDNNRGNSPTNTTFWTDITARLPFVVLTAATTIGGVTYPAGTYINTAFIADATITNAKIQSLVADKITTGSLTAAIGITTGRISGGVNPSFTFGSANFGTGFYLGNDGGVYKLYVGSPDQNMNWNGSALTVTGNINAVSGTFRNITIFDNQNRVILSSGGINTSLLNLPAQQITGLGSLATQSSVFVGQTVRFPDGTVMNTGDFVNRLSKIGEGNISTFIDGAAITDAYIGNLNAAKITAGTIAADRLDSTVINAKITNIDAAKIASGVLDSARIGTASIDTLKIAGGAVTVTTVARGTTNYRVEFLGRSFGFTPGFTTVSDQVDLLGSSVRVIHPGVAGGGAGIIITVNFLSRGIGGTDLEIWPYRVDLGSSNRLLGFVKMSIFDGWTFSNSYAFYDPNPPENPTYNIRVKNVDESAEHSFLIRDFVATFSSGKR